MRMTKLETFELTEGEKELLVVQVAQCVKHLQVRRGRSLALNTGHVKKYYVAGSRLLFFGIKMGRSIFAVIALCTSLVPVPHAKMVVEESTMR
ncbi:hypothetical protein KXD40_004565 [Peronospora effusa]|uniref:Uncharacterized protein n=1 Tax=Peronospora effusa TaxID=542832 RepID=A0A3M6V8A1_9STRA|nr:hypothetical protein DD238_007833 [Peronospora effusa]UIZ27872.1 hypothetical protein KXD40_004565 [Peronospora effusa]